MRSKLDMFVTKTKRLRTESISYKNEGSSSVFTDATNPNVNITSNVTEMENLEPTNFPQDEQFNQNEFGEVIEADPGVRKQFSTITRDATEREQLRRAYIAKGPCQPKLTKFPVTFFSGKPRKFNPEWYNEFERWLEYSEKKDAAYCLCCYLFYTEHSDHRGGHDAFVDQGFKNWKKKEMFNIHVGDHNSIHYKCLKACDDLMKQKQHIDIMMQGISTQAKVDYRVRLNASIECVRLLLMQALPFRGHDESEFSSNQGNFLAILKFLCKHNEEANKVSLKNAPENHKLCAPSIQKDICNAAAFLTTRKIIEDIGDDFYSILVDEARDCAIKEQMVVGLRYVNKHGCIIERILGIVHVPDTTSRVLKETIDSLFATHGYVRLDPVILVTMVVLKI